MNHPPGDDDDALPSLSSIKPSVSGIAQSIMPKMGFRGKNVSFIITIDKMPAVDWKEFLNSEVFPDFSDGYNENLYYNREDERALREQTEIVREAELESRRTRRERMMQEYKLAFKEWEGKSSHSSQPEIIEILSSDDRHFGAIKVLGEGQFGRVYEAIDLNDPSKKHCAIKVAKPDFRYRQHALHEVQVMRTLKESSSPEELNYILKLDTFFIDKDRVCIVFEALSYNLFEVLKLRSFKGLPLFLVQSVIRQLLISLITLEKCGIVHSDIKPENILLVKPDSSDIKLADFGSARFTSLPCSSYTQSRYYRAPEVVLGIEHDFRIDIWSVGCVAFELFSSMPLFAGQNEVHLLQLIVKIMGQFPSHVVKKSPRKRELFLVDYKLKSEEQICSEQKRSVTDFQYYFAYNTLDEIVMNYENVKQTSEASRESERKRRVLFLDLLKKMLNLDPLQRITAQQALGHPFLKANMSQL